MSFLYRALIKEQHNQSSGSKSKTKSSEPNINGSHSSSTNTNSQIGSNGVPNQTPMSGNSNNGYSYANTVNSGPAFADSGASSPSFSWLAWLAIAILLLIVGLLGGYIVGSKPANSQAFVQNQNQLLTASQPTNDTQNQAPDLGASPIQAQPQTANQSELPNVTQSAPQIATQANGQMESDAIEQLPSSRPSELLTQAPDEQLSGTSQLITEKQFETDKNQLETGKEEAIDESEQLVINVADINSSNVKVEDVSSDLQARFAEALAQTEVGSAKQTDNQQRSIQVEVDSSLVDINDLPDGDRAFIPELQYEMHIYSSDVNERWVRINNTTLYEGDRLTPYLRLAEIRQGIVIWESRDRRFSQMALEDYK
ncbi:hypothetical protein GCM10009128_08310 [Psychrosphaera haliotis]|uniref:general secretion pathway protein GspB n=1 Tax=Psychrosphaera haliotis TaxID=555083 RepID=UPI0031DE348A